MRTPTVGFIYPDHAAEDDYALVARTLGARLEVAHIYGTDLHAVPELLDLGSPDKLRHGARLLAWHRPAALVWACTSGSFVFGPEGAREQVRQLAAYAGVPASSTSIAFVEAARALGVRTVAVAASYPDEVARLFVEFLADAGITVVAMASAGIDTAAEVGTLTAEQVLDLAVRHDHPDAQALLIPDTAMHTLAVLARLETALGKPVLTANQVTVWEGLRLSGGLRGSAELGALFADPSRSDIERPRYARH
ncbi:maleate cis-trans isomerase [Nocardia cyriacigeorgica]|uniref:maleate cis-trans isomerase family protein n=1 Tax=Nocardia cyriacigeorgica TaxID=135487 RepID=UPI0018952BDC|nr:maleate cis-trans isomerase [Nocardia cyriacigeorgica]MBF6436048.1 maleate cis-trans isomerase [Nocardia cyriacigeorgica]MBF6453876.1 maleate cis-trans isomerase [Nocardia cyriacigeorgica]MBF6481389.1 maleate cis-trans isomerase [Nocardia cyriacigeorgica]MBF6551770.1 maleate cis-trans isomerase [Nocardia cyriacigeorgica]